MTTRSSLELMLHKLQQLEEEHPADTPPPLPLRPVSRARRPRLPLKNLGFQREITRNRGVQVDHFLEKTQEESGKLDEREEKGICKIQKWYRGHRVRCCYRELTRGAIALQSFIRGQNARRGYKQRCTFLTAIIIIQKQGRKYLEHQATHLHSGDRVAENTKDQTRVPYTALIDLQKRVVRTEAKLRAKKEENAALKRKLLEIEKKWQQREERMTSMEKEWQDQLTYIQECLAAAKTKIKFSNRFENPENGRIIHIPMNSNNDDDVDEEERVWLKHEELRKVRVRFKEWKKEYKNKLSSLKKLGKSNKNWWGRLSN